MNPSYLACNSCGETFRFNSPEQCFYYLGQAPLGPTADDQDPNFLDIPVRPAWCKDCDSLCYVEDIASTREIENAYVAVRSGRHVEYPVASEWMEPAQAEAVVGTYLRWRLARRRPARALCCGGMNYQRMDVELPLIKHAECDFGFITPHYRFAGAYCGGGHGAYNANIPVHNAEGELIGRLTWGQWGERVWQVEPASYPLATKED